MTVLAHWSTAIVLAVLATVGVVTARFLSERHSRAVLLAPNWAERNQRFAAADQAIRRTRQWMFAALWIVTSVFSGYASREVWIAYLVTLVVTNNAMKRVIERLWAVALRESWPNNHTPFVTGAQSNAIGLGYASYILFIFAVPGVFWIGAAALLIAAVRTEAERHKELDLSEFTTPAADPESTFERRSTLGDRLSGDELNAWITFEVARHVELAAGHRVATAQKLMWFALAVFVGQRTSSGDPLLAAAPIALTVLSIVLHQAGNQYRRRLEHRADGIGSAAVVDQAALGRAFEIVANERIEPLLTNGRGTNSWWDRMERIGHSPAHPKPTPLTVAPALRMIGGVSLAMFLIASLLMPLAHATGSDVEAAVVLGTGQQPATVWGGTHLLESMSELLRTGASRKVVPSDAFSDPELASRIRQLDNELRSGCAQSVNGAQVRTFVMRDDRVVLLPTCD